MSIYRSVVWQCTYLSRCVCYCTILRGWIKGTTAEFIYCKPQGVLTSTNQGSQTPSFQLRQLEGSKACLVYARYTTGQRGQDIHSAVIQLEASAAPRRIQILSHAIILCYSTISQLVNCYLNMYRTSALLNICNELHVCMCKEQNLFQTPGPNACLCCKYTDSLSVYKLQIYCRLARFTGYTRGSYSIRSPQAQDVVYLACTKHGFTAF